MRQNDRRRSESPHLGIINISNLGVAIGALQAPRVEIAIGLLQDIGIVLLEALLEVVAALHGVAVEADNLMGGAVELKDAIWRRTGAEVEAVDILGDKVGGPAIANERCDGAMGLVGQCAGGDVSPAEE
jgi:phage-related tail protein